MPRVFISFFVLLVLTCAIPTRGAKPSSGAIRYFETHIRPLLVEHCHKCHGPKKQKGGLRLDARSLILAGGESGPAMVPGKPQESLLLEAVNYESYEMPPAGKLSDKQIGLLTRWVKLGAPWPKTDEPVVTATKGPQISADDRAYWAFQPVRDSQPPQVQDDGWSSNAIDAFIFRRLSAEGLTPAKRAEPLALLRRAYFDLIGLPPSPAEIEQFMGAWESDSETAYKQLIDRLLEDPRYGQRWARHWLDLVRYAESDGYKQDAYRPHAWRYRDYVIRSLNDDKPYDQFIREQLAGDEIAPDDPDAIIATGFLRHWIYEYNQRDVRTQWDSILNDVTDVTGDVFLAMGMGCARCHDHKFDPILQRDYFRLRAFFAPLVPRDDLPLAGAAQLAVYRTKLATWEEATQEIRQEIAVIEQPHFDAAARPAIKKFPPDIRPMMAKRAQDRLPLEHQLAELAYRQAKVEIEKVKIEAKLKGEQKERWQQLKQQLAEYDHLKPQPLPPAFTVADVSASAPPTVIPGDSQAQDVPPGYLSVLNPADADVVPPPMNANSTGRRTALANWIASADNPLSTRVIVNRVWQYHFGRGLVPTSSDFGRLGESPTHPELLDWMTSRFVEGGWRLKDLHRRIMLSATYQQTADVISSEAAKLGDPNNSLLWRFDVRRLEAEQIRDAMLSVSGELDPASGGPSVDGKLPRRTIYTKVLRNLRDPLLDAFDAPDNFNSTSERSVTTTPTQSLLMINGQWTLARAAAFASRLQRESVDDRKRVTQAYLFALGRPPTADQAQAALAFLDAQTTRIAVDTSDQNANRNSGRRGSAWVDFCHVLLNSNEFLYVD